MAADQGDAGAQYGLGTYYYLGRGIAQNYTEAARYFRMAADQGNANAQFNIGNCYKNGQGVAQDNAEAARYFRMAADQGEPSAQFNLGNCYYYGKGVTQDYVESVKYYQMAADQGHAKSQYGLGTCYFFGQGVSQNYNEAVKYFRMAADQGDALGQFGLGKCYYSGAGVPVNYYNAVKFFRLAADQGHAKSQFNLGICYAKGLGVTQSYKQAVKYFNLAANQGDAQAQNILGISYQKGNGVSKNQILAAKYFRMAADQGLAVAQKNLGNCYERGEGVAQDLEEAVKYYKLAAEQGESEAQQKLHQLTGRINNDSNNKLTADESSSKASTTDNQKNEVNINNVADNSNSQLADKNFSYISDVDQNIPQNALDHNTTTFAIIIANENYNSVSSVPFALNDGEVLEQYLTKSVGLPEDHVKVYKDASLGNMHVAMKYVENLAAAFGEDLNLIFYYSGHGMPDEKSKNAMLIPTDGDASVPESCYEVNKLVSFLGNLGAGSVVVLLDACFSGTERGDKNLVASKGVRIRSNQTSPAGNMVILSASQGDETAYPYEAGKHGLFTYFILKKLQEKKGDVTIGELYDYVATQVKRQSVVKNGKLQNPSVTVSPSLSSSWRNIKLKN